MPPRKFSPGTSRYRTTERCPGGAAAVLVFEGGPLVNGTWQIVPIPQKAAISSGSPRAPVAAPTPGVPHTDGIDADRFPLRRCPGSRPAHQSRCRTHRQRGPDRGGTVVNRVPHEASAELEVRAYDPALLDQTAQALRPSNVRLDRTRLKFASSVLAVPPPGPPAPKASAWPAIGSRPPAPWG